MGEHRKPRPREWPRTIRPARPRPGAAAPQAQERDALGRYIGKHEKREDTSDG